VKGVPRASGMLFAAPSSRQWRASTTGVSSQVSLLYQRGRQASRAVWSNAARLTGASGWRNDGLGQTRLRSCGLRRSPRRFGQSEGACPKAHLYVPVRRGTAATGRPKPGELKDRYCRVGAIDEVHRRAWLASDSDRHLHRRELPTLVAVMAAFCRGAPSVSWAREGRPHVHGATPMSLVRRFALLCGWQLYN
jgi:hypothetical protein